MSKAPIMPFYTDAYLADTHHLSAECHGAYLLLLLHTWRCNGAPPADDDRILSRITRLPLKRWKVSVRPQLESFFHRADGQWRQARLEAEWHKTMAKIEQQRQRAVLSNWSQHQKRANPLPSPESPCTSAATSVSPSINHDPSSTSSIRTDGLKEHSTTPALTALKPILSDVRYFVKGGQSLSPSLAPQLAAALAESSQLLSPMGTVQAKQQLDHLRQHFAKSREGVNQTALEQDYITTFAPWPVDIGASVVTSLLASHPYPTLPPLSACIERAQPHLTTRQKQHERLQKLQLRMEL